MKRIPCSGKVVGREEVRNITKAAAEMHWTEGQWAKKFCKELTNFFNMHYCILTNSGSSSNMIATLSFASLWNDRIKNGEIITSAVGFPTTVNSIFLTGGKPVFVDIDLKTLNPSIESIEKAITKNTKGIVLAHTLGIPFPVKEIKKLANEHDLFLIEDTCDAFGSVYDGRLCGTYGDIMTLSFYPAHHITTGEGGAVLTNDPKLYRTMLSIRDWGRHCWCPTGKNNTCGKRFAWKLGELPFGFDHKFIYHEMGFNLKMTDLQAAIGVAQIKKVNEFIKKRRENYRYLAKRFEEGPLLEYFEYIRPPEKSDPSWFGFPIIIKDTRIKRNELIQFLSNEGIDSRMVMGGNLTRQPYMIKLRDKIKINGPLKNSDIICERAFWVGCYPGLKKDDLDKIYESFEKFIKNNGF